MMLMNYIKLLTVVESASSSVGILTLSPMYKEAILMWHLCSTHHAEMCFCSTLLALSSLCSL